MTEDKIKEAFEAWVDENSGGYCADRQYREHHELFEARVMACLNSLKPTNLIYNTHMLYRSQKE